MRRVVLVLVAAVIVTSLALLLVELRRDAVAVVAPPARDDAPRAMPVHAPAPPHLASVPSVAPRAAADVDALLRDVEAHARTSGAIDRGAVDDAHRALRELAPTIGADEVRARAIAFGERLRLLDRELQLRPARQALAALREQLAAASDAPTRERLRARYEATARTLPGPYRIDAMQAIAPASRSPR